MYPDKSAHNPPHSEPKPRAQHPSANTYTDKSLPCPATSSRQPNKTRAAHSANKDQTLHHNPALHPTKSPTTANPQSWPAQTLTCSAADRDPHSAKQAPHDSPPPAAPQSKKSAHAPNAAAR